MFLVQHGQLKLGKQFLGGDGWLMHRKPGCVLGDTTAADGDGNCSRKVFYIDNFASLSTCSALAESEVESVIVGLTAAGVDVSPDPEGSTNLIGCCLSGDGQRFNTGRAKLRRLSGALQYMLHSKSGFTGKELEIVLGHVVYSFGLRRALYSCLFDVYTFVRLSYHKRQPLWKGVRRELLWCWALLPLCYSDLSSQWSEDCLMYDASGSGYGIVEARIPADLVGEAGRIRERGRFRKQLESDTSHRDEALLSSLSRRSDADLEHCGDIAGFASLDAEFLERDWQHVYAGRWHKRNKSQNSREAATRCWSIRHLCRSAANIGLRHLLVGDNMSVVLAADKNRSGSLEFMHFLRTGAAYQLASSCRFYDRWLPSERNRADEASRAFESPLAKLPSPQYIRPLDMSP